MRFSSRTGVASAKAVAASSSTAPAKPLRGTAGVSNSASTAAPISRRAAQGLPQGDVPKHVEGGNYWDLGSTRRMGTINRLL